MRDYHEVGPWEAGLWGLPAFGLAPASGLGFGDVVLEVGLFWGFSGAFIRAGAILSRQHTKRGRSVRAPDP